MSRTAKQESESALIDRLVLGHPSAAELLVRVRRLREAGWTLGEIAVQYDTSEGALSQRLKRARAGREAAR